MVWYHVNGIAEQLNKTDLVRGDEERDTPNRYHFSLRDVYLAAGGP